MKQLQHSHLWNLCPTQPCRESHGTCSIRTRSLSSLSLSKRSRSSFCLSISSLWRSRRRFSRSSRSRRSRSVISRRLEEDKSKVKHPALPPFSYVRPHVYTTCGSLQLDARAPSAHAFSVLSSSQMARCPRLCEERDAACSSSSQTETGRRYPSINRAN